MRILLANPRGFCAGVNRAISIVEQALEIYGAPIYLRHEIVHNRYIIDTLQARGVVCIEQISEVPNGSILIFSAHGVSPVVRAEARSRNLTIFDATCPLVTKIHMKVARASNKGNEVIFIGHTGHPEVEGTIGQYSNTAGGIYLIKSPEDVWQLQVKNVKNLYFVTQTTLSVDDTLEVTNALRHRFPSIMGPRKDDICYATTNRQEAIRNLTTKVDLVLVVGSKNSSNSNRLFELVRRIGKPAYLIDCSQDIQEDWLYGMNTIGITAGASAPDILVREVITYLQVIGGQCAEELIGCNEKNITFKVPKNIFCLDKYKVSSKN